MNLKKIKRMFILLRYRKFIGKYEKDILNGVSNQTFNRFIELLKIRKEQANN